MKYPQMSMNIRKIVDGHRETVTLTYDDISKAANVFCERLKQEEHFIRIIVYYSLGTGFFCEAKTDETDYVYIQGDQHKDYENCLVYYNYPCITDIKDAPAKFKLLALKLAKRAKIMEQEARQPVIMAGHKFLEHYQRLCFNKL